MHGVKLSLDEGDLLWSFDFKRLEGSKTHKLVFLGVCSQYPDGLSISIVLELLDLKQNLKPFLFILDKTCERVFGHLSCARGVDKVASTEQVIDVPNIIRLLLQLDADLESVRLEVNYLFDNLHICCYYGKN